MLAPDAALAPLLTTPDIEKLVDEPHLAIVATEDARQTSRVIRMSGASELRLLVVGAEGLEPPTFSL
jgi:hypothetical protein